ncbi:unnamed protein product [Lupinus luteus]|uniref:Uncharacterized protein n=1 Tax=Lupinus luteus TaxID=3873 RepID=A0AAV1WF30_LUPLU
MEGARKENEEVGPREGEAIRWFRRKRGEIVKLERKSEWGNSLKKKKERNRDRALLSAGKKKERNGIVCKCREEERNKRDRLYLIVQCLAAQTEPSLAQVEFEPVSVAPLPTQAPPADDVAEAPPPLQAMPPPMQAEAPPLPPAIVVSA